MLLAGKIVIGLAMGVLNSTCQTYISEIAPPRLRGPLLSIFQCFLVLGQMIGVAIVFTQIKVAGDAAYRVAFASQWAFAGVAALVAFIIPESPTYLLKRNKTEGAHKSLVKLHDPSTVDATIIALQATLEHERKLNALTQGISYIECFKGSNWRRTRIALIANALQQFLGITLVSNATYFLELGGMSPSNSVMVLCRC
jgi:MFS family permease